MLAIQILLFVSFILFLLSKGLPPILTTHSDIQLFYLIPDDDFETEPY